MFVIISFISTFLIVYGVTSTTIETQVDSINEIWRARINFNAKLLRALDHKSNGKNVVVSPFGLHSALSAVLSGFKGETYQQLWNALGFNHTKLTHTNILKVYEQTFKNLTILHDLGLNFANLLVVDEHLSLEDEFQKVIKKNFDSTLMKEDFIGGHTDKATKDINEWINNITKGKISKLFDQTLNSNIAAIIANALHFKSSWRNGFDEKRSFIAKFNLLDRTIKNVTYMTINAENLKGARYSQNYGFENVQIPFDNSDRLWFGIMLPNYGISNFDCCTPFTQFIHAAHSAHVELTLPKFDISQNHNELKEILKEMGVKNLFNSSTADLSGIDGKHDLFVSNIAHKATVKINENGTEAAAATGIFIIPKLSIMPIRKPIRFVVDRPFIFSISDRLTGIDLFTGIVYDPTEN